MHLVALVVTDQECWQAEEGHVDVGLLEDFDLEFEPSVLDTVLLPHELSVVVSWELSVESAFRQCTESTQSHSSANKQEDDADCDSPPESAGGEAQGEAGQDLSEEGDLRN